VSHGGESVLTAESLLNAKRKNGSKEADMKNFAARRI